jgi:hypothetical protein
MFLAQIMFEHDTVLCQVRADYVVYDSIVQH